MAKIIPLITFCRDGTTRAVLCIGPMAFKFARSAHGRHCNRYEADLYRRSSLERRALLCPPLCSLPFGAVLVMRRAAPMTQSEFRKHVRDADLMSRAWDYCGPGDDGHPFEPKASDWGWLDDRPVAIDYANLDGNAAEAGAFMESAWLSIGAQYALACALFTAALLATLYVFYGSSRAGIIAASLVIAVSLFGLRKIARGLYGSIEVLIGIIAIVDASTKGRGAFSSGFSAGFQRYEWSLILLQTAAAIYLTIRGLENIEQWWSARRHRIIK
jgi:hypothetical protein